MEKPEHVHTMRRAYKRDWASPSNMDYTQGPRWILLWACTSCPYKQAYDLTHTKPGKE